MNCASISRRRNCAPGITILFALAAGTPASAWGEDLTVLASFARGSASFAGVTLDANGNLYGTTFAAGTSNNGTVWELASGSGTINTLASFNNANGSEPYAGVTLDAQGNLYGTTYTGPGLGTVWELANGSGSITALGSFANVNGSASFAGVTFDASGNMFGTTYFGGANNGGTVWEIAAGSNTLTNFASFGGGAGINPYFSGVTFDASGNMYGTTLRGGDGGTVWEIASGGNTVTTVASFNGTTGGNFPYGGVTLDANGNLYGTTYSGGANGDGTVWEIVKGSNTITTLASFNGIDGINPWSGVSIGANGNLYGTTFSGGANDDGTVWEILKGSNAITTLVSFNGIDGADPAGGVTLDANGNLYGTTPYGGAGGGVVWEIASAVPEPSSIVTALIGMGLAAGCVLANRPGTRPRD